VTADLVIKGGLVVDGSGTPGHVADIAVNDGRIVAVAADLQGMTTLDASKHVVGPGFIDIHTHYDAQVFWDPALSPSCYHGVTTVIAGNCGFSIAPTLPEHRQRIAQILERVEDMDVAALEEGIPWDFVTFSDYRESLSRRGIGLNYGLYAGHTALRLFVMGAEADKRAATRSEIVTMGKILRQAMGSGAMGLSTSFASTHIGPNGSPVPSRHATLEEFEALCNVVAASGRGVVELAIGPDLPMPTLYDLQMRVGIPFTYGALLTSRSGSHRELLELNREGWARGAAVWPQVTPRPLLFSFTLADPFALQSNPEFAGIAGTSIHERRQVYGNSAWRQRTLATWTSSATLRTPMWDTYEIAESGAHPELIGVRLSDVAATHQQEPFDTLLDLALDEPDLTLRVNCVVANDDEAEVADLLRDEHCTLGLSDAGAHVGQLCDAPQATDLLGGWVRDRSVLTLEEAVRKLTGQQADLLGLGGRGYIEPGAWADLVVFDPSSVGPGPLRRVRDFPANSERLTASEPTGLRHVLVNGSPIRVEGEQLLDQRPGQLVSPGSRA